AIQTVSYPPAGALLLPPRELPPALTPEPHGPAFADRSELSLQTLVQEVLARNPSLAQMVAAWQAASARYPQVTSLEDPMLGTKLGPGSFGSNQVDLGYMVEVSQKLPWPGKLGLRGDNALSEASAASHDVEDMHLQ